MLKRSGQVALCGMIAALCILLMLMTGLFPFATYALPAVAGLLMVAVVVECGVKWAVMVYVAVSLLAVFITPDREAMLMFVFFFGHYPILKVTLEKIRLRPVEWLVKFGIFNACVLAAYAVIIFLFQMPDILTEMGGFGRYSALVLLLMGNVVFFIYDIALSRLINAYVLWFRPKVLRRFQ